MNSGTTLYEEALALRAEVREVVILLENWNTGRQPTRGGGGATPPAGVRQGDRSERMKETIRYETYDGHNCRSYVGDEITEQIALRRARGYAWFEYHDLPIAAREELGDSPTLAAVRECVRGITTGARV